MRVWIRYEENGKMKRRSNYPEGLCCVIYSEDMWGASRSEMMSPLHVITQVCAGAGWVRAHHRNRARQSDLVHPSHPHTHPTADTLCLIARLMPWHFKVPLSPDTSDSASIQIRSTPCRRRLMSFDIGNKLSSVREMWVFFVVSFLSLDHHWIYNILIYEHNHRSVTWLFEDKYYRQGRKQENSEFEFTEENLAVRLF